MASYLQIENISKSYGPKVLFENIGFNINEGDKIALIAPNGTGKSTLLRILAGKDKSDSGGKITFLRNIRIAFLEQEYEFDPEKTAFRQVIDDSAAYMEGLDEDGIFAYELRVNKFLSNFEVGRDSLMKNLSGGEVKRVALARMLASDADFFIMDEPTNHLDINAIEYLENYLGHSRSTLLMVTHDRYFLDRIVRRIFAFEENGHIRQYEGGYSDYLIAFERRYGQEPGGWKNTSVQKKADTLSVREQKNAGRKQPSKLKFSYKEQREFETIESDIEELETKIADLEAEMMANASSYGKLSDLTKEKEETEALLEQKMERWEYLTELAEKIEAQKS